MAKQMIGFVGVGRMGGPMARRLLQTGFDLTIYDKSEAAISALEGLGATRAGSPAEVASAAEIVLASLPTPPIVQAATLGPNGIGEGTKVIVVLPCNDEAAS